MKNLFYKTLKSIRTKAVKDAAIKTKIKVPVKPMASTPQPIANPPVKVPVKVEAEFSIVEKLKADLVMAKATEQRLIKSMKQAIATANPIRNNVVYRIENYTENREISYFVQRRDNGLVYLLTPGNAYANSYTVFMANGKLMSLPEYAEFVLSRYEYPLAINKYKFEGSNVRIDISSSTTI